MTPVPTRFFKRLGASILILELSIAKPNIDVRKFVCKLESISIPSSVFKGNSMLYTIGLVLIILWLLGFISAYTIGGFIHILLVIALILFLIGFINGRRRL
jgi:hypothetical protein